MSIEYSSEPDLATDDFLSILRRSGLAARRPVDDPDTVAQMLRGANLILTARHDGMLVGVSRAITDHAYCVYLSDLAVDADYQRRGIGRELITRTHQAVGTHTRLILLSAPAAVDYYTHLGLHRHEACFTIEPLS